MFSGGKYGVDYIDKFNCFICRVGIGVLLVSVI